MIMFSAMVMMGHIEIENINDSSDCVPHSMFDTQATSSSQLSSKECKDISFDENCFEEGQYISKNNESSINGSIQKNELFSFRKGNPDNNFNQNKNNVLENQILENYTNISLLI